MTSPLNSLTTNNNIEKTEEINKYSLSSKAKEEFIYTRLKKDINHFDLNDTDIDEKLFNDFSNFLSTKEKYGELAINMADYNDKQKEIITKQLKTEVLKRVVPREKLLKNLEDKINSIYILKVNELNKIKDIIKTYPEGSLKQFLEQPFRLDELFLKTKIFKNKEDLETRKKDIKKFILDEFNISEKKLKKLPLEAQNILLKAFYSEGKINLQDISLLFDVLDDKSKILIIKYFLDTISLADLENYNVLDKNEIEKIKEEIKKEISLKNKNLTDDEIKDIFDSLDKSEIFIDPDSLSSKAILSLTDNNYIKEKIVRIYNKEIEKTDNQDYNKILDNIEEDENGNIHNSFINFVKNDDKISLDIKNSIDKFREGNFIVINEGGKNRIYKVNKVDYGAIKETKTVILEDITALGGVKKGLTGDEKKYSYPKFYDLLSIISNSKGTYTVEFLNDIEFKNRFKEVADDGNIETINDLKAKLDVLDPEGKDIPFNEKQMVFSVKDNKNGESIISLEKIDETNKTLIIKDGEKRLKINFEQLLNAFQNSKISFKRQKKVNSFEDIIAELSKTGNNSLDGIIYNKKGDLIPESEKDNKNFKGTKFLIGENGKAIYIDKIEDGKIKYYFGEYKEKTGKKGQDKINFKSKYYATNFNDFLVDIKNNNLEYNGKKAKEIEEETKKTSKLKHTGSWFDRYMAGLSLFEMYEGLKVFPETIKKKLERGGRLNSLKFAKSLAGKFFDKEGDFYLSLVSDAAEEEKKLRDDKISALSRLGSKDMLIQIQKILENKDSPKEDVMAAMFKVVGKYGTLYPKGLKEYRGNLEWYKRIGGTKEFEIKFRNSLKEQKTPSGRPEPVVFTEERLVEAFLGKLEKAGELTPRTDKEFGNALSKGIKEEMEDGDIKAGNKATTYGRLDYFLGEIINRGYANAVGSLGKIYSKNGSSMDMQMPGFILAASGAGLDFDQVLLNQMMNYAFTTPYNSLYFTKGEIEIKQYQNFIKKLIEKKYPSNNKMLQDYVGAIKEDDFSKRVKLLGDFWTNYGNILVDHITLKDPFVVANQDIPEFKIYYETLKEIQTNDEYGPKDDDIKAGVFDKNPVNYTGGLIGKMDINNVGNFRDKVSKKIFYMYINGLEEIRDSDLSIEKKKKLFKENFQIFENRIRKAFSSSLSKNIEKATMLVELREKGLDVCLNDCTGTGYEKFLDEQFNKFIGFLGNTSNISEYFAGTIDEIIEKQDYTNKKNYNFDS